MKVTPHRVILKGGNYVYKKYIVFKLGEEDYAVEIMSIKEIAPYQNSKSLPQVPSHVEGIINLRGEVITTIDLRKRLNLQTENQQDKSEKRIIIPDLAQKKIGYIVDNASHILEIEDKNIQPTDSILMSKSDEIIYGIARYEDKVICVLDLKKDSQS